MLEASFSFSSFLKHYFLTFLIIIYYYVLDACVRSFSVIVTR
jgi:hypothetical protein